jgi:hypothetical protein
MLGKNSDLNFDKKIIADFFIRLKVFFQSFRIIDSIMILCFKFRRETDMASLPHLGAIHVQCLRRCPREFKIIKKSG